MKTPIWTLRRLAPAMVGGLLLASLFPTGPAGAVTNGNILFVRGDTANDRTPAIFSVNPDGTGETRVLRNANFPAWAPNGQTFAFVKATRKGGRDIFVMDAGARKPRQLTNDPADDVAPDWSPDASKIVWTRDNQIWVMNSDGSNEHPVVTTGSSTGPAWAPDGGSIAFASHRGDGFDIWVVPVDAAGNAAGPESQLTGEAGSPGAGSNEERNPSWRPDGAALVYDASFFPDVSDEDLWSVDSSGATEQQLYATADWPDSDPMWAPLGDQIAFECDLDQNLEQDICVVNADGTGAHEITTGGHDFRPDWGAGA